MRSIVPSALRQRVLASLLLALAGSCGLAHAGSVDVRYVEPARFSDAGHGLDAERVRDDLTHLLQALGAAWLPAGQSLRIEVLDIDLAGEIDPWLRPTAEIRILKGRADWPRIQLRYTLSESEQVVASGDATVSDPGYLDHPERSAEGALPYETRMLTRWFRTRFAPPATAQAR